MDYLNYNKEIKQQPQKPQPQKPQPQKPQPQGFGKNVQITKDDLSFGDLTYDVNPTIPNNQQGFGKQQPQQPQPQELPGSGKSSSANLFEVPSITNSSGDSLFGLFPVPVLICPCPFRYDQELELFRKEPCSRNPDSIPNDQNQQSDDTFILDRLELKRTRSWIEEKIKVYMKDVMASSSELVITQSWLNRNRKNERHHSHKHPNSFISGVWYPYIHEKLPPIEFKKAEEMGITPELEQFNLYNSATFMLPMKMGELIIFPSSLTHSVPMNISDEERISLSFNTWIKGNLGDKKQLTYLPLDRCV